MQVVKVLNNSLVLALNDEGHEIILMGKGIGFHKAAGYRLKKEEVEKVFVLEDRSVSRSIIRLAADVDSVFFEITKKVIDYAKEHWHMQLMDHIYLSLTDHLAYAVRRVREGVIIPDFYALELRRFNEAEFDVGEYALKIVEEKTGIALPEDEASNVAFHFINAQLDHPYNERNRRISQITEEVLTIVRLNFHLTYDRDSITYSRYVTHVRLFAQRLVSGSLLPDDASSQILFEQIHQVLINELACTEKVDRFARETMNTALSNQEKMYLALHIHRVLEDGNKK
ncbi:MAG: PRD domain-containing protein [Eubacteriales bacterium]|nr:PRD domain-containing protein [Eubacteriales bacterium]